MFFRAIFKKFDVDGSGEVEWVEFVSRLQGEPSPHKKKKKKKRQGQGPHYMDVTEDWVREHDLSVRDKPTLASADKSWEQTLHGAKIGQGDWTLTTPHSKAHHVADDAFTEILLKLRASAYVVFEREAREYLFSYSLTQRTHSCHVHNQ